MTEMPHPGSGPHDLMDLLTRQHEQIDALMQRVLAEKGAARKRAFGDVRAVLSRHEAAEQDLLRPLTRTVPDGDVTAPARPGRRSPPRRGRPRRRRARAAAAAPPIAGARPAVRRPPRPAPRRPPLPADRAARRRPTARRSRPKAPGTGAGTPRSRPPAA